MSEELKQCYCGERAVRIGGKNAFTTIAKCQIILCTERSGETYEELKTKWNIRPEIRPRQDWDEEAVIELIQNINFESFGFSHEDVAMKIAQAIIKHFSPPRRGIMLKKDEKAIWHFIVNFVANNNWNGEKKFIDGVDCERLAKALIQWNMNRGC